MEITRKNQSSYLPTFPFKLNQKVPEEIGQLTFLSLETFL